MNENTYKVHYVREILSQHMSNDTKYGVIDFGPVDWNRIWGDRAALVTPEHLRQLNDISPGVHLRSPGYWRNLFAGFAEVQTRADFIARTYVRAGETPKAVATTTPIISTTPAEMNKWQQTQYQTASQLHNAFLQDDPSKRLPTFDEFRGMTSYVADRVPGVADVKQLGEQGVKLAGNVVETGKNLLEAGANVADIAKDLTGAGKEFLKNPKPILDFMPLMVGGVVLVGLSFLR